MTTAFIPGFRFIYKYSEGLLLKSRDAINGPIINALKVIQLCAAAGLFIFGYYALKGEYSKLPESSEEI